MMVGEALAVSPAVSLPLTLPEESVLRNELASPLTVLD